MEKVDMVGGAYRGIIAAALIQGAAVSLGWFVVTLVKFGWIVAEVVR